MDSMDGKRPGGGHEWGGGRLKITVNINSTRWELVVSSESLSVSDTT